MLYFPFFGSWKYFIQVTHLQYDENYLDNHLLALYVNENCTFRLIISASTSLRVLED